MKFFTDSDVLIPVKWYFTNRPMLPIQHSFGNRYWSAEGGSFVDGVGEDCSSPRPWRNGSRPVEAGVMGVPHYCGTPEQWLGRMVLADAHMPDALGRDPCCRPPPPLPAKLGLAAGFKSGGVMGADYSLDLGVVGRFNGRGAVRPLLAATASLVAGSASAGVLSGRLSLLDTLLAVQRATGHASPVLAVLHGFLYHPQASRSWGAKLSALAWTTFTSVGVGSLLPHLAGEEGLGASSNSRAGLQPLLSAREGLSLASAAVGRLAADLSLLLTNLVVFQATGRLPGGLSLLIDVSAVFLEIHRWTALLSLLETLSTTTTGIGGLAVLEELVETLKAQLAAQGHLATTEAITEAIKAALGGQGAGLQTDKATVTVKATMAAFQVVTPAGGCGSLPASLVLRFSGGTGSGTAIAGDSVTLTFAVAGWQGTYTHAGDPFTTTWSLGCVAGVWKVGSTGYRAASAATVTGTSGASPNLAGTATFTSPSAGTTTCTITRT